MTEKKISFGFSKLKTPTLLVTSNATNQLAINNKKDDKEMIQCLEGQTIKILGQKIEEKKPLVIPLQTNTKTSAALAALKNLKNTIEGIEEDSATNTLVDSNTAAAAAVDVGEQPSATPKTLEQKAAQEILDSLKQKQDLDGAAGSELILPIQSADELPLDGAKESTLDDYEDIPIQQFGFAMLRGMGWKDEQKKNDGKIDRTKFEGPIVRPKGMGLGADKMIKQKPLLVPPANGEILVIKKSACVRVLSGKHKDLYGMVSRNKSYNNYFLIIKQIYCSFKKSPVYSYPV